jgi:outer membrane protein, multidrug efflux system
MKAKALTPLLLLVLASLPVRAEVLTLQQAVEEAVKNSPELKATNETLVQAQEQLWQAYSLLLPFVSIQGSYTRADEEIKLDFGSGFADFFTLAMANCFAWDDAAMGPRPGICDEAMAAPTADEEEDSGDAARVIQALNNFDASLSVGISILNARTFPLIKNVYSGRDLARLQVSFAKEQLIFSVTQMYYGVSTGQVAVRVMKQNLATAMRQLDFTEARIKGGVALENERLRASIGVLQARNGLDQAQQGFDLARRSLALLMGREDATFSLEEFPENPWTGSETESASIEELNKRLDLQMYDKLEVMAERGVTDVRMKFIPTLQGIWNFSASSNKGFADRFTQWRGMITLSWSVFEGGMRFAEADIARSKVRAVRYQKEGALLQARMEVEQAVSGIKSARTELATTEEMVELATKNLELVQKQYKLGVAQQTVIIDAESMHISSQFQVLQNKLKLALAQISLAKSLGLFGK